VGVIASLGRVAAEETGSPVVDEQTFVTGGAGGVHGEGGGTTALVGHIDCSSRMKSGVAM
jgi:hypothetical protein